MPTLVQRYTWHDYRIHYISPKKGTKCGAQNDITFSRTYYYFFKLETVQILILFTIIHHNIKRKKSLNSVLSFFLYFSTKKKSLQCRYVKGECFPFNGTARKREREEMLLKRSWNFISGKSSKTCEKPKRERIIIFFRFWWFFCALFCSKIDFLFLGKIPCEKQKQRGSRSEKKEGNLASKDKPG